MADFLVILILVLLVAWAIHHIIKQKKNGAQCMGCSCSGSCPGKCDCKKKQE